MVRQVSYGPWRVKLYEYCCSADSSLGEWFIQHGMAVRRLGLPEVDLRRPDVVNQVLEEMRRDLLQGWVVLLWVALPCGSWSQWQHLNLIIHGPLTCRRIQAKREESRRMIALLARHVAPLIAEFTVQLIVGMEWPAMCGGWGSQRRSH